MITIRQLVRADAEIFRRVRLLGLQESPTAFGASYRQEEPLTLEDFAQRLDGAPDRWFHGAFAGSELVGIIGFGRYPGDKARHKGYIWGMYVVPQFRGRGIGQTLLGEALAQIDALPGLRSVRLSVVTSNLKALRLYEKHGFVRYAEESEASYVDGVFYAEYHMSRKTQPKSDPIAGPNGQESPA